MRKELKDCFVEMDDDRLTLGNSRITRRFRWNNGNLISTQIEGGTDSWPLRGLIPDMAIPGELEKPGEPEETEKPAEGTIEIQTVPATAVTPEYLECAVLFHPANLEISRRFRIYPGTPAIACDYWFRGSPASAWSVDDINAATLAQIENAGAAAQDQIPEPVLDRIACTAPHTRYRTVQFFDVTDRRNNLVRETTGHSYRRPERLAGQLLVIEDLIQGRNLFMLKEAPCTDVQLAGSGFDFVSENNEYRLTGMGLHAHDVPPERWRRGYSSVVGLGGTGTADTQIALHRYQQNLRAAEAGRDHMVMLNTWGDRNQDKAVGAAFCSKEIEAAARLGISHFQIDDGWQKGRSANSAFGGTFKGIWDRDDYWSVNEDKFPDDLFPVLKLAHAKGIELCLWFNPDKSDSFANWQKDAACLIAINQRYGIRTFKIDGVDIPDKTAEENLRAMFDRVLSATGGTAVFNLDVTAGRRFGYHYFSEYGNKFVENRYTDWSNYMPHWTLRNLWQLSRWVPSSALQIEFLNIWRNTEKYADNDPLAPGKVPFEYCFALTMMAQPLAWFEASNLPAEAFTIGEVIRIYRRHQQKIHNGIIIPMGEEPSGISWTGFHSMGDDCGYMAVYREYNDQDEYEFKVHGIPAGKLKIERILGQGECTRTGNNTIRFSLPGHFSYGLFRYGLMENP